MRISDLSTHQRQSFKANKFIFDELLLPQKIVNAKNEIISGLSETFGGDNLIRIVPETYIVSSGFTNIPDSVLLVPKYDAKFTGNILIAVRKQIKTFSDAIKTFLNYGKNEPIVIKNPTPKSIREAIVNKLK